MADDFTLKADKQTPISTSVRLGSLYMEVFPRRLVSVQAVIGYNMGDEFVRTSERRVEVRDTEAQLDDEGVEIVQAGTEATNLMQALNESTNMKATLKTLLQSKLGE